MEDKQHIAASFQRAALTDIVDKTGSAAAYYGMRHVVFGGGVSNNRCLRQMFAEGYPELNCYWPGAGLSLDNAAMIAGLGFHTYLHKGCGDELDLEAVTRIPFIKK